MRILPLFSLALIMTACTSTPINSGESFRQINIPKREHGYSQFKSQAIKSEAELQKFLEITKKRAWNNGKTVRETLNAANVDFATESIVLLRHTEGSGSTAVSVSAEMEGTTFVVNVTRKRSGMMGTADMAYYCFAYVVPKFVAKAEIRTGKKADVVQLK